MFCLLSLFLHTSVCWHSVTIAHTHTHASHPLNRPRHRSHFRRRLRSDGRSACGVERSPEAFLCVHVCLLPPSPVTFVFFIAGMSVTEGHTLSEGLEEFKDKFWEFYKASPQCSTSHRRLKCNHPRCACKADHNHRCRLVFIRTVPLLYILILI